MRLVLELFQLFGDLFALFWSCSGHSVSCSVRLVVVPFVLAIVGVVPGRIKRDLGRPGPHVALQ